MHEQKMILFEYIMSFFLLLAAVLHISIGDSIVSPASAFIMFFIFCLTLTRAFQRHKRYNRLLRGKRVKGGKES